MTEVLRVEADLSGSDWMCLVCGTDLCRDETRKAKTKLILRGGLDLVTGTLGLTAEGPDSKIVPLGHAPTSILMDVFQNAGWVPPLARTPTTPATRAIAFGAVDSGGFWKSVCLGPHMATPSSVAVETDGKSLWLTANSSPVGKLLNISSSYMKHLGWSGPDASKTNTSLLRQKGAIVGLALGGSLVLLLLIVLLAIFLKRKCGHSTHPIQSKYGPPRHELSR